MNARATVRAALLDNMLKLTAGMPLLDHEQTLWYARQRMTAFDLLLLERVREEDLDLLNSCVAIECAMREQAFDALARLLAMVSGGDGSLTERVHGLPEQEQAAALICLYELGWIYSHLDPANDRSRRLR